MQIISKSEAKTKIIGQKIGRALHYLLKERRFQGALSVLLMGDLGSGKTTFVKGFAKAFKIKEELVISPTFIIYNKFDFRDGFLYHFDLYRLKKGKDLIKLGFKDILKQKNTVVLIEWAEKLKNFKFNKQTLLKIYFQHIQGDQRKIMIKETPMLKYFKSLDWRPLKFNEILP